MGIITNMANMGTVKLYVRTTSKIRAALKRVLLDLGESPPLSERGKLVSQETFVCATWLMFRDMEPAVLARQIAPYIDKAECLLLGRDVDGIGGPALPISPVRDETQADVTRERASKRPSRVERKGSAGSEVHAEGDREERKVKGKPRSV